MTHKTSLFLLALTCANTAHGVQANPTAEQRIAKSAGCMQSVMEFLPQSEQIQMQALNKRCYGSIVPNALSKFDLQEQAKEGLLKINEEIKAILQQYKSNPYNRQKYFLNKGMVRYIQGECKLIKKELEQRKKETMEETRDRVLSEILNGDPKFCRFGDNLENKYAEYQNEFEDLRRSIFAHGRASPEEREESERLQKTLVDITKKLDGKTIPLDYNFFAKNYKVVNDINSTLSHVDLAVGKRTPRASFYPGNRPRIEFRFDN
jgi:hypothetical protein